MRGGAIPLAAMLAAAAIANEAVPQAGPTAAAARLLESTGAGPVMPQGFVAEWTDPSGLAWREIGTLPLPLDKALAELKETMGRQGYVLRHDITGDAFGDRHLFLFIKGGAEATVMVWPDGDGATMLCWGVTTPGHAMDQDTNTFQKATTNEKDN